MSSADDGKNDVGNEPNPFAVGGIKVVDPANIGTGDSGTTDTSTDGSDASGTDVGTSGTEPVKKRRGRKPGSKNTSKATVNKESLSGLETVLFSVHLALAAITKMPELALDQDEAHSLAEAATRVQAQYDMTLDPKLMAWGQLIIVAGTVYGTRAIAISTRIKKERIARKPHPVENVLRM